MSSANVVSRPPEVNQTDASCAELFEMAVASTAAATNLGELRAVCFFVGKSLQLG
jgi:hypothetical protein